jgi:hypothetical protein
LPNTISFKELDQDTWRFKCLVAKKIPIIIPGISIIVNSAVANPSYSIFALSKNTNAAVKVTSEVEP